MTWTADVGDAEDWLKLLPNIDCVVAKRRDSRYLAGQCDWVNVKRRRSADGVVIGVASKREGTPWLVLGLRHPASELHHSGLACPSTTILADGLAAVLAVSGPERRPIRSRRQHAAVPVWRQVQPTAVCEVAHSITWRPLGGHPPVANDQEEPRSHAL